MRNLELYTTPLRKFYSTVKNLDAFFTELIEAKANTLPQNDRTVEYSQLLYNILVAWFDLAMLDKEANRAAAKTVCKRVRAEYGDKEMTQEDRLKAIAEIKNLASGLLYGASDKAQAKELKDLLDAANIASDDIIKKGKQSGFLVPSNNSATVIPHNNKEVPDNKKTSVTVNMGENNSLENTNKINKDVDEKNNTTLPSGNNMPENTTINNNGVENPVVNDADEGTVVNLENYKYTPAETNKKNNTTTTDENNQVVSNIVVYYDKAKEGKQKFKISIRDLSKIQKLSFVNLATNELKEIDPANVITVNIPQSTVEQKIVFNVNGEEYTRLYVAALWPQEHKMVNTGKKEDTPKTEVESHNNEETTHTPEGEHHEASTDKQNTPNSEEHKENANTESEAKPKPEETPDKEEEHHEEAPKEKEDKKEEELDEDFMKNIYEGARDNKEETPTTATAATESSQPEAPVHA